MDDRIRERLLALEATMDPATRLSNDPVRFVHRYEEPADQEVAGFIASTLAYGRVALFAPIIQQLLDEADRHGGPRAWVEGLGTTWPLTEVYYRFHRPADLHALLVGLGRVLRHHGSLGGLVRVQRGEADIGPALSRMVQVLREGVLEGLTGVREFRGLARGVRYSLVDPASGSASKRLLMYARWMVRRDAVDVGCWSHVTPARLVMPVDTHVHRISLMTGLTRRRTADWRTALELTERFRVLDPHDPVRFDFALAHLGISQGCTGKAAEPCEACALRSMCTVG